jgi:hypothetical protein
MQTQHITADYFQSESISSLIPALVTFQVGFQNSSLKKDAKNEHLRNSYVSLDNLLHVIRPILSDCGLVVVQQLAGEYLTTVIYHVSGEYIGANMPFNPMAGNKGTNALQELGGGITYAKRYSLSALLQISVDVDNDGQDSKLKSEQLKKSPAKKKVESIEQLNKIVDWVLEDLSRHEKVNQFYDLDKGQFEWLNMEIQNRTM